MRPHLAFGHVEAGSTGVSSEERRRFAVYAVETIDEGVEILTGVPAGRSDASGEYAEGTINRRVADRLRAFAERRRRFAVPAAEEEKKGERR